MLWWLLPYISYWLVTLDNLFMWFIASSPFMLVLYGGLFLKRFTFWYLKRQLLGHDWFQSSNCRWWLHLSRGAECLWAEGCMVHLVSKKGWLSSGLVVHHHRAECHLFGLGCKVLVQLDLHTLSRPKVSKFVQLRGWGSLEARLDFSFLLYLNNLDISGLGHTRAAFLLSQSWWLHFGTILSRHELARFMLLLDSWMELWSSETPFLHQRMIEFQGHSILTYTFRLVKVLWGFLEELLLTVADWDGLAWCGWDLWTLMGVFLHL